jgi:hypothetical protein
MRSNEQLTQKTFPGNLRQLNELARTARADHIIHTGDFGFYDEGSLDRIAEKFVLSSTQSFVHTNCFSV